MGHTHYHQIKVANRRELGSQLGERFRPECQGALQRKALDPAWGRQIDWAEDLVAPAEIHFPALVEEVRHYAQAAKIDFRELWALSLEGEFPPSDLQEKCTTVVPKGGTLVGHNEDWGVGEENTVGILKKTVGSLTTLELYYYNTLGGNALSINSHGFIQSVNTLCPARTERGVPRNVVARWLSETGNPELAFQKLKTIPRIAGYSYTWVSAAGPVWNLETSGRGQSLDRPSLPFIHTNHYLGPLKTEEGDLSRSTTHERFEGARWAAQNAFSEDDLRRILEDPATRVFDAGTVARAMIDLKSRRARLWLRREAEKGWVDYELDFLP